MEVADIMINKVILHKLKVIASINLVIFFMMIVWIMSKRVSEVVIDNYS